jgi:hypothetical protein
VAQYDDDGLLHLSVHLNRERLKNWFVALCAYVDAQVNLGLLMAKLLPWGLNHEQDAVESIIMRSMDPQPSLVLDSLGRNGFREVCMESQSSGMH